MSSEGIHRALSLSHHSGTQGCQGSGATSQARAPQSHPHWAMRHGKNSGLELGDGHAPSAVKNMNPGARPLAFKSWLCHLPE